MTGSKYFYTTCIMGFEGDMVRDIMTPLLLFPINFTRAKEFNMKKHPHFPCTLQ